MTRYKVYTKEKGLVETIIYNDIRGLTLHNEDGPAFITYDVNGNIGRKVYYINNKRHREEGPAYYSYYNNDNIAYEAYFINNKRHRLDGPGFIGYNINGNVEYEEYWINDMFYTKEQYDKELLKLKVQSL